MPIVKYLGCSGKGNLRPTGQLQTTRKLLVANSFERCWPQSNLRERQTSQGFFILPRTRSQVYKPDTADLLVPWCIELLFLIAVRKHAKLCILYSLPSVTLGGNLKSLLVLSNCDKIQMFTTSCTLRKSTTGTTRGGQVDREHRANTSRAPC